jgi:uncharacterized protein (DUF1778 family)
MSEKPTAMRRTRFIHSRVTPQERHYVREAAEKCGVTVSAFLYNAAMKAAERCGVFEDGGNRQTATK